MNQSVKQDIDHSFKQPINISLYNKRIQDIGAEYLSKQNIDDAKLLVLTGNQLTNHGIKYLMQVKWKNLTHLNIYNHIGSQGCKYLLAGELNGIQRVMIGYNLIGNEGVEHLSKAEWPHIETLALDNNQIFKNGINSLSKFKLFKMVHIYLNNNCFNFQGVKGLFTCEWLAIKQISILKNLVQLKDLNRIWQILRAKYDRIKSVRIYE